MLYPIKGSPEYQVFHQAIYFAKCCQSVRVCVCVCVCVCTLVRCLEGRLGKKVRGERRKDFPGGPIAKTVLSMQGGWI